ncbi:hypothetical protein [Bacillus sp. EB01]|uniref:hypothetical protein n=1 Tax=Bacillus sp. EB01 TaxID=1347086 RepID=UPI0005C5EDE6|nr:hypothetical protein [Bacillus sp. EB01]
MDQRHVTLWITDKHNNVIVESEMNLEPGDVLLAKLPNGATIENAMKVQEMLKRVLNGNKTSSY